MASSQQSGRQQRHLRSWLGTVSLTVDLLHMVQSLHEQTNEYRNIVPVTKRSPVPRPAAARKTVSLRG